MAMRKRTRRKSAIEQTLRDAQDVLSGYIESGGKQVKETMRSLLRIFDMEALTRRVRATGGSRSTTSRPARATKRSAPSRRGRSASATPREAASRRRPATRRSKGPKLRRAPARRSKRTRMPTD